MKPISTAQGFITLFNQPVGGISWDIWLRYTDDASAFTVLGAAPVESYITMDMRLGWHIHKDVEISLVGQNLLNDSQLEYISETFVQPTENQRGFMASWLGNFSRMVSS